MRDVWEQPPPESGGGRQGNRAEHAQRSLRGAGRGQTTSFVGSTGYMRQCRHMRVDDGEIESESYGH